MLAGIEEEDDLHGGDPDPHQQASDELLTPLATQDPSQPMSGGDGAPPPMQWKTLREAPEVEPQAPLSDMVGDTKLGPVMPDSGASDITLEQRAQATRPREGFDWSRAFFAAGGGDLSSFDAERNRQRNQPFEDALNQEKLNEFSLQKQRARDAVDPGSHTSLEAQKEFTDIMQGRANQLREMGRGTLAAEFDAWAKRAPSMHSIQIANALKSPRMGEVLRAIDSQSRNSLAEANLGVKKEALGATTQDRMSDNARANSELDLKRSELDLRHKERADALAAKQSEAEAKKSEKLPEGGQVEKYSDRKVAASQVDRALELLPNVRYTGSGAETINQLLSSAPGGLDVRNDSEREFAGILNDLRAHARNKIFGAALSKYDLSDAKSFLASLGTNPATIKANLLRIKKAAEDMNAIDDKLYPGLPKRLGGVEQPPASATTAKRVRQNGHTYEQQPDGSYKAID